MPFGVKHMDAVKYPSSIEGVARSLSLLQNAGEDFELEIWALARQLKREVENMRTDILQNEPALENSFSMLKADAYIEALGNKYAGLRAELLVGDTQNVAKIVSDAIEAYFWLSDLEDPCSNFDRFDIGQFSSRAELMDLAEATNNDLVTALTGMENELQGYMNDADNGAVTRDRGQHPENLYRLRWKCLPIWPPSWRSLSGTLVLTAWIVLATVKPFGLSSEPST